MADSPQIEKGIQTITSISELPKGGTSLDLETEKITTPYEAREKLALWSVNGQKEAMIGGTPVWLIVADSFESDMRFAAYKTSLRRNGYTVERVVRADRALVRAIQDATVISEQGISESNSITEFYEKMVAYALSEKVSDIHLEKRRSTAVIRMRKHGQMVQWMEISTKLCHEVSSVIYNVLAENKEVTFMPTHYQSAAVNTRIKGEEVKLRYQSLPVYPDGFDVVLRVLPIGDEDEGTPDISLLGYSISQVQDMLKIVAKPVGALVIAGTTGSGKSTTLKNLLMLVNEARGYRCKIYTIEDPPEYKIPRVSQIPVVRRATDDSSKSPFHEPLVATMRGDPDILMIGEIRDKFTGDGLKKATQSGHQVLTTVHASSALGVVERLADFGITPSVMGSPEFLNGLIYQKLMPLICQHCSIPFIDEVSSSHASHATTELAHRLQEVANLDQDTIRVRNPQGCERCRNMGVVGRTVCAEVIAPDFAMLRLFRNQAAIEAKIYWRSLSDQNPESDNMTGKTVLEHALLKMRKGLVSPFDVEDLLGPVNGAKRSLEEMRRDTGVSEPEGTGPSPTLGGWKDI